MSEHDPPMPTAGDASTSDRGRGSRLWRGVRWFLPLGVALVLMGIVALFAYGLIAASRGSTLVSEIAAGERPTAPEFKLESFWPPAGPPTPVVATAIRGGELDLRRLRGHPVVLNFWASWCIACRAEAKLLVAEAATQPGVVFIGVDVQDLRSDAIDFLRRYGVTYTSVWDKTNSTYEQYGLTGVPETYYLDRHGRIVAHDPGPVSSARLTSGIQQARG